MAAAGAGRETGSQEVEKFGRQDDLVPEVQKFHRHPVGV